MLISNEKENMVEAERSFKRNERVLSQQASDTRVLLNLEDGNYFALDEVGSQVWELCDGSHSAGDIIAALAEEYDAPRETIAADVAELLRELIDAKLVVEVS